MPKTVLRKTNKTTFSYLYVIEYKQRLHTNMKTSQLLCTFVQIDELESKLKEIQSSYTLVYNYIYVLKNKEDQDELYITYNIDSALSPDYQLPNTILVHRKKETNTLYTINALNQLIKEENGGYLDRKYIIDWSKFRNQIILTSTSGSRIIHTKIHEIIKLENEEQYY